MADVSEIDIGGIRWTVKDRESREKITALEKTTTANFDYTEVEQEIGTWIDGKPIYRLVIQGSPTNKTLTFNLSNRNIKQITKMNGMFDCQGYFSFPFPCFPLKSSSEIPSNYVQTLYNPNNKALTLNFGSSTYYSTMKVLIQVEYTKNE